MKNNAGALAQKLRTFKWQQQSAEPCMGLFQTPGPVEPLRLQIPQVALLPHGHPLLKHGDL